MELRLPAPEQLREIYARDLAVSFPREELKPLRMMETLWSAGRYRPYCLFHGDKIVGECFLWLGRPGWALLDYLCVPPARRNGGLGAMLLRRMREAEPEWTVFLEAESPDDAPDPAIARRRLGFYRRSGTRTASFESEVFGVPYRLLYWSKETVPDSELIAHYGEVYRTGFSPEKFQKYIRVPRDPARPTPRVPWVE